MMLKNYVTPAIKVISLEGLYRMAYNIFSKDPNLPQWSRKMELEDYWDSEDADQSPFPWDGKED